MQTVQLAFISYVPTDTLANHSAPNSSVFNIPPTTNASEITPTVEDLNLIPARTTDSDQALAKTDTPSPLPSVNSAEAFLEKDPSRAPS